MSGVKWLSLTRSLPGSVLKTFLPLLFFEVHLKLLEDGFILSAQLQETGDGLIPPSCLDFKTEREGGEIATHLLSRNRVGEIQGLACWREGLHPAPTHTPSALRILAFLFSQPLACSLVTRAVLNGALYEISSI